MSCPSPPNPLPPQAGGEEAVRDPFYSGSRYRSLLSENVTANSPFFSGSPSPRLRGEGVGGRGARAFTLIEVLVVAALMGILILAVTYGFVAGLDTERTLAQRQASQSRMDRMEARITALIRGAKLSETIDDDTTYLIGETAGGEDELGADRLTLTTVAPGVSLAAQDSQDDFETQQETNGPVGGVAEVSIGTTPTGDAGDLTGLFERIQRPSDNDATQGGRESLLEADIDRMGFQFYNGTEWVTSWDTITGGDRRLPAAVQVSYTVRGDAAETVHRFIVPIPASDVDAQDPATNGSPL